MKPRKNLLVSAALFLLIVVAAPIWPYHCSVSGSFLRTAPLWELVGNWYMNQPF